MASDAKKIVVKHVLVVDDDDLFRGALTSTLKLEGYKVTAAQHGKVAQDIIGFEEIDMVISDINMPGVSGIELMHFVKRTKPDLPVILMTGFADLKETTEAYELGARGFLPKPFKKEELLKILRELSLPKLEASQEKEEEEEEDQDINYCKLSIDDFVSGREIKYDIYVRLSEEKYIKIAHEGENIAPERISSYKAKNIRYLYMQKEDFRKYMDFNLKLLPLVKSTNTISKEKKRSFLKHTSEVILEHLYLNGVDEEGFQNAKTVVEATASLFTDSNDMMNMLSLLDSHSDVLYAHSLGVSTYGVMIAKAVRWHSPANIYKVAMGGLLHDLGMKEIDREVLKKARVDMTPEDITLYQSHPHRGAEILKTVSSVPSDVLQIVLQHHEDCMGLGFPSRLTKNRIHPMARLIAVADEFCSLVLRNANNQKLAPREAIQRMISLYSTKLDPMFFVALMTLFKVDPPEDFQNKKWESEGSF